jgi:hypothetical protein
VLLPLSALAAVLAGWTSTPSATQLVAAVFVVAGAIVTLESFDHFKKPSLKDCAGSAYLATTFDPFS